MGPTCLFRRARSQLVVERRLFCVVSAILTILVFSDFLYIMFVVRMYQICSVKAISYILVLVTTETESREEGSN
jgi:hypothetical protein